MITIIEGGIESKYFPAKSEDSDRNFEAYPLSPILTEDLEKKFDSVWFGYELPLPYYITKRINPNITNNILETLSRHEKAFLMREILGIPGIQASMIYSNHAHIQSFPYFQSLVTNPNIHLKGQYADRTSFIQKFSDLVDNYSVSDWEKVSKNISNNFALNTRTATLTALKVYKTDADYEPGFVALLKSMGDSVLANLIALDLGSERGLKYGWPFGNEFSILPHAAKAAMMEIYQHGMGKKPEFLSMFLNSEQKPLSMGWLYQNQYQKQDRSTQIILSVPKNRVAVPITHPKLSLTHWL